MKILGRKSKIGEYQSIAYKFQHLWYKYEVKNSSYSSRNKIVPESDSNYFIKWKVNMT